MSFEKLYLLLLCALALGATICLADEAESTPNDDAASEGELLKKYEAPDTSGLHFVETFDGDVLSRWKSSKHEKYNGEMQATTRKEEAIQGDLGLLIPDAAKHYGYSTTFKPLAHKKDTPFIVQYEVKFQEGLQCGGAYLKLFDSEGRTNEEFDADTRYVIMFGPDRCGATNKVHFILQHKSPKTGKWEEKHFKEPPSVPQDQQTHLYGLVINSDNSVEIQIDGQVKASGNLLESMTPPVNPPKEIDDPADSKPVDWVEQAKMDDPESSKPDDWDEDEQRKIVDPEASMPAGWLEDATKKIPDPAAKMPSDWDEEEDGEWEAPIIDNPACTVGCEKWVAPEIDNPKYKGKWIAPLVDNPAYKGEWKPRQIENPEHFVDEQPSALPNIDSIGLDIWTMQGGIMFDNFVVADDLAKATAFTEKTFKLRNQAEDSILAASRKGTGIMAMLRDNLVAVAITLVVVMVSLIWFCCLRSGESSVPPAGKKKEQKAAGSKDKKDAKEDDASNGKETQNGDSHAKADEGEKSSEAKSSGDDADEK